MAKKFIGLAIAVLLLFSLVACNPPKEDEDMGLKVGFGADAGDPASPIKCAYGNIRFVCDLLLCHSEYFPRFDEDILFLAFFNIAQNYLTSSNGKTLSGSSAGSSSKEYLPFVKSVKLSCNAAQTLSAIRGVVL